MSLITVNNFGETSSAEHRHRKPTLEVSHVKKRKKGMQGLWMLVVAEWEAVYVGSEPRSAVEKHFTLCYLLYQ